MLAGWDLVLAIRLTDFRRGTAGPPLSRCPNLQRLLLLLLRRQRLLLPAGLPGLVRLVDVVWDRVTAPWLFGSPGRRVLILVCRIRLS